MAFDPERLRKLRIKRKFTQKGIAALLKIPYQNYQNYEKPKEKGGYAPKMSRLQRIAEVLGTTPDYLTGQTADPIRPVTMDDLGPDEQKLIGAWRRANAERKNRVLFELFREDNGS